MSTIEQNKATVIEFVQSAFTKGDLDAAMQHLSDGFVNHDPVFGGGTDRQSMREAAELTRQACPDWHSDLHLLVGEGDIVVERFTASGTHQGELFGAAPTGRRITLPGINIWRVSDGVITDRWGRIEDQAMLAQLGLATPPAGGAA